ncbi:MAG: hypothetical protein CVV44_00245 [Spirochaetae bacterium HGW-Spirochaetae-1]|jgi:hypothetical protein|nr:MAG: hypothetical protein CVV44_00245 [Spirochaetae bacterium HGW-Spirochaetae-1]
MTLNEVTIMDMYLPTFYSLSDFFRRFLGLFSGPLFLSAFRGIDPVFREKLLLTVSMTNNCAG